MIVFEIIYIAFVILLAVANAITIKEKKYPSHLLNAILHISAAIATAIIWWIPGFIIILCNTNVVFSISLNLFRGERINYISPDPKSWIDKLEKKLFGNDFYTPKVIYILVSITLNVLYLVFIRK